MADDVTALLAGWREAEQAATPGPWTLEWDSCDCGDGYGCSHGSWPYTIRMPRAHTERPDGKHQDYDFRYSEISELSGADAKLIVTARTAMPRLVAAVEAVLPLHVPITRRSGWRPTCKFDNHSWPCAEYRAITSALTGEEVT